MASTVNEVMTHDPRTVDVDDTLVDAAREMRDGDVGPVIVTERGRIAGILTDRDIAVRAVAEGLDPGATRVGEVATRNPTTVTAEQSIEDALRLMREQDVRRLPVEQGGRPAGIVSLGDLAVEREPDSALADISAASPNN